MRIDDIVNIADAELINAGYITEILAFSDNLKKVKREDLFISNDILEIKEAIKKGAYAILFSDNLEIIDDEIAWIKVENINESLLKLLKYKLLDKVLFVTDDITIEIIKSINKDKKLAIIDKIEVDYLNNDYVFITSLDRIKNISINKQILTQKVEISNIDSTIFISNFIYKNKKYSIHFPEIYLEYLQKAFYFFEDLKLNYSIKKVNINRFIPQFINSKYEKLPFGKSNKVVIKGIRKDKYFIRELNFIFKKVKYANVKFYDNANIKSFFEDEFNFAFLIDCDIELKEKNIQEVSLF